MDAHGIDPPVAVLAGTSTLLTDAVVRELAGRGFMVHLPAGLVPDELSEHDGHRIVAGWDDVLPDPAHLASRLPAPQQRTGVVVVSVPEPELAAGAVLAPHPVRVLVLPTADDGDPRRPSSPPGARTTTVVRPSRWPCPAAWRTRPLRDPRDADHVARRAVDALLEDRPEATFGVRRPHRLATTAQRALRT